MTQLRRTPAQHASQTLTRGLFRVNGCRAVGSALTKNETLSLFDPSENFWLDPPMPVRQTYVQNNAQSNEGDLE